jgi:hypothetical protein
MDEIERSGIRDTASLMSVSIEELLDMVGIKGTQEDMLLVAKVKMEIFNIFFIYSPYKKIMMPATTKNEMSQITVKTSRKVYLFFIYYSLFC